MLMPLKTVPSRRPSNNQPCLCSPASSHQTASRAPPRKDVLGAPFIIAINSSESRSVNCISLIRPIHKSAVPCDMEPKNGSTAAFSARQWNLDMGSWVFPLACANFCFAASKRARMDSMATTTLGVKLWFTIQFCHSNLEPKWLRGGSFCHRRLNI